jgi:hypothetical protein
MSSTPSRLPPTKLDRSALRNRANSLDNLWEFGVLILGIHTNTDTTLECTGAEEEVIVFGDIVEGELDGGGIGIRVSDGRGTGCERVVKEELAGDREVVGGGCGGDRHAVDTFRKGVQHLQRGNQYCCIPYRN